MAVCAEFCDVTLNESFHATGLFGLIAGAGVSVGATLTNQNFAKFMSISAKTSLPIMAGLGLFTYGYEISMHDAMR